MFLSKEYLTWYHKKKKKNVKNTLLYQSKDVAVAGFVYRNRNILSYESSELLQRLIH